MGKRRIEWVDCAKGIGIILVIIGHTVNNGKYGSSLKGMIFSFHMPLFFILSCMTFKCSENIEQYRKKTIHALKHLAMPAIGVFALVIIIECRRNVNLIFDLNYWKQEMYCLLFASGAEVEFNGFKVRGIGIPWFFFVLFIGRTIFDYLHLCFEEKQLGIISIISCMIGIFFGSIQWLPFSLDIALAVMPFFYFGYKLKKMKVEEQAFKKTFTWGIVWISTLYITFPDYNNWTYLELAMRRYNLFPICYLTAIAGTMMTIEFSLLICNKLGRIMKPIMYIGRNSLYLLCIHIMEYNWYKIWYIENHQFYSAIKRTIVDLLILIVFMCVKSIIKSIWEKVNL